MKMHKFALLVILIGIVLIVAGCGGENAQEKAARIAQENADNGEYYMPKNGVERRNYNWRQENADDPNTILWCTFSFPNPSSPLVTVPIAGKLTSGDKRPYPTEQISSSTSYSPEIPGPDGMYGSSGEYRYGFGPTGQNEYYDFYNLGSFCTSMPTVWQRENTSIVIQQDKLLSDASARASKELAKGTKEGNEEAFRILSEAANQVEEQK